MSFFADIRVTRKFFLSQIVPVVFASKETGRVGGQSARPKGYKQSVCNGGGEDCCDKVGRRKKNHGENREYKS